jgi:hypothetical protein
MNKCSSCKQPHNGKYKTCDICREKKKESMRKLRINRLKLGLCQCGKPVESGYTQCYQCRRNRELNQSPYRAIINTSECKICGFSVLVHVHHIDGDHENNNPNNLIALCPNHHATAHAGMLDL